MLDIYYNETLTGVVAEVEVTNPKARLRVADRFTVNAAGRIVEQVNHFDLAIVTNLGWQSRVVDASALAEVGERLDMALKLTASAALDPHKRRSDDFEWIARHKATTHYFNASFPHAPIHPRESTPEHGLMIDVSDRMASKGSVVACQNRRV